MSSLHYLAKLTGPWHRGTLARFAGFDLHAVAFIPSSVLAFQAAGSRSCCSQQHEVQGAMLALNSIQRIMAQIWQGLQEVLQSAAGGARSDADIEQH